MNINIGIDASRGRSGGAKAHLIGIVHEVVLDKPDGLNELHIWSYPELLDKLPNCDWIVKHSPKELNKSLPVQLYWQYAKLPSEAKFNYIDVMLNIDAGTVCPFQPSITMSRDMLSYEKGEMQRYRFGFLRIRLELLKIIQNRALRKSTAAIFLTKYAFKVIQQSSGIIKNTRVINHGVSNNFRIDTNKGKWKTEKQKKIKCVYVSNLDLYKHQWNVALAIADIKKEGYDIEIDFIGGGHGLPQQIFNNTLESIPDNKFIKQLDFVKHNELPSILREKDIIIFASSCENMPNTLIEGMCTGLPIACSNRGPMPEVLKDAGVYFDPESVDSIKSAVKEIITNESLRENIARKSKELSKNYSWKRCSKETFDYLIEIAKQNKTNQ